MTKGPIKEFKHRIVILSTKYFVLSVLLIALTLNVEAQKKSYAAELGKTVMQLWPDSLTTADGKPVKWAYDQGVILKGIEGLWYATGKGEYFKYMQKSMDFFVNNDGTIRTYKKDDYNIDNVLCGRILLTLYKVTGSEKYYKAASLLRSQLASQPRTNEGGFWHKKRYPYQMWLDGLYMGEPFYAEWAATFHEDTAFNDIARQFMLMESHSRDAKTGLMYHGYDESRQEKWSDKTTGRSSNFWARAMGWYGMGLVDALENFPSDHPKRKALIDILNRFAEAIKKVQDNKTGLWFDVLNYPDKAGNYVEASSSSMFIYALAKGVRLGYLPAAYLTVAKKGYDGLVQKYVRTNDAGQTNLEGVVAVSGLGGSNPYRDGSYEYYISEKVVANDPKGVGAFIMAANEIEMLPTLSIGKGKTVLLDNWFNNETKKDVTGRVLPFHYVWSDEQSSGFSILGRLFRSYGAETKTLNAEPTISNLKKAGVYIIVDPDNEKETTSPHFIEKKHIDALYDWVKNGGVLVLMANDSANVELPHFNQLVQRFGIHFSDASRNMVKDKNFEMGAVHVNEPSIFPGVNKVYIKELSILSIKPPAKAVVKEGNDNIIAVAKVGKGTVFAVGDPWLYNEYIDGRKIPAEYQNFLAGKDLVEWLVKQAK